jgi:glutamate/tyrosine decarboxylase-like PLP-dependent enzyme
LRQRIRKTSDAVRRTGCTQEVWSREMSSLKVSNEELARLTQEAASLVTSYWASVEDRRVFPASNGEEIVRRFSRPWAEEGFGGSVLEDFQAMAEHARISNGRFFGYVAGSGEPVGAVAELLVAALNQNVTSWRSAPAAVTVEQTVVDWLADAIGCPGYKGSLCGGGSSANLMGLAMAREDRLPGNETGARPGVIYASEQAHMSIAKAVALIGVGRKNLHLVPVDSELRMRVDALEDAIAADRRAGRQPIAIVATAGTVNTGAIDPLSELADVAEKENLWLHVDGAFGVIAAMAVPLLFKGIDRADSLSLDAHKWLYQTIDCSCLLYRNRETACRAFRDRGDYVKIFSEDPIESFAFFDETIDLTRRFRALKLWMSLQYHGRRAFRDAIAQDLSHAQLLAQLVKSQPGLELLAPVPLSAVCFRHRVKDNESILKRVIARGRVYLSNATINGHFALRACFVNHRTTKDDVQEIVSEVIAAADEINR